MKNFNHHSQKKRLQMYQLHCNNGTWWSGKDIVLYLLNNQMKLIPLYPYVAEITLDSVRFFKEINKGLTKILKYIFWINIQRKKFAGVTSFKRLGDLKQYDHKKLIFIVSRVIFCSVICFVARDSFKNHQTEASDWRISTPCSSCSVSLFRLDSLELQNCDMNEGRKQDAWIILLPHGGKILLSTNVATNPWFLCGSFVCSSIQLSLYVSYWKSEMTMFMSLDI